jgi:hypothetical protein
MLAFASPLEQSTFVLMPEAGDEQFLGGQVGSLERKRRSLDRRCGIIIRMSGVMTNAWYRGTTFLM